MAENKKSFVLYTDSFGLIKQLPDDVAGRLFKHIFSYVNDENPESNELLLNVAFEPIKQQLKRDLQKYELKRKQWSEAGKRSAEQRKSTKVNENQRTLTNVKTVATESTVSVNDSVNVSVSVNDSVKSKDLKNIPSFQEFELYAKSKEPLIKISSLKNKYDAWVENGWKDGHDKPIKNWKSKLLQTINYLPKDLPSNNQKMVY